MPSAYYWAEENFDLVALAALMVFAILARKIFGLFESLAPLFFFGGALILFRIFLRAIKAGR